MNLCIHCKHLKVRQPERPGDKPGWSDYICKARAPKRRQDPVTGEVFETWPWCQDVNAAGECGAWSPKA